MPAVLSASRERGFRTGWSEFQLGRGLAVVVRQPHELGSEISRNVYKVVMEVCTGLGRCWGLGTHARHMSGPWFDPCTA